MSDENQQKLIDSLMTSQSNTKMTIKGIDLEHQVYKNPAWQIRDILWHITVWDRQVTESIRAFINGSEYFIPDFNEDEFNNKAFLDGRKLTDSQLLAECDQARLEFRNAVQELPADKFSLEFLYPWGDEKGDISTLVGDMVDHDAEHRAEIAAVISS